MACGKDPDLKAPIPYVSRKGRPPRGAKESMFRQCSRHGWVEFQRYGIKQPHWRCKRCVGEAVTRRKQKVRRILIHEWGGCCARCGYDRTPVNLHFHHVEPSTKSFAVNAGMGKSLQAFREEAKKCVLLCADCHGEVESGYVESPPPGATFLGVKPPW